MEETSSNGPELESSEKGQAGQRFPAIQLDAAAGPGHCGAVIQYDETRPYDLAAKEKETTEAARAREDVTEIIVHGRIT
jgi:hypothetical protein